MDGMLSALRSARAAFALALALVAALVCAAGLPASAWAASGTVELGTTIAERVEAPESGDAGTVELGAAVGLVKKTPDEEFWGYGGTLEIGCAVGLSVYPAEARTVTFDAGKGDFGNGPVLARAVPAGSVVGAPVAPKRSGWKFGGWHLAGEPEEGWDAEGASAVPLGAAWDFSSPVAEDVTLYARWELRLDVTVPVAAAFAINAETLEVKGPSAGAYVLKSRTVRPVVVESVGTVTQEANAKAFFRLSEKGQQGVSGTAMEQRAWARAIARTNVTLETEGFSGTALDIGLGDGTLRQDEAGAGYWSALRKVDDARRDAFTVPAFDYLRTLPDDAWEGRERCERLPLTIRLAVNDNLEPRVDIDGPKPITRLKLTVSAKP